MRLSDFILKNVEPILADWEIFARSIHAGANMDKLALRDHAEDILRATARDMTSGQSAAQQTEKSIGHGEAGSASVRLTGASEVHAIERVDSGFDLVEVIAEYRALRASVIRLWRNSEPNPDLRDLEDLTRFNESIDQSLTEAVRSYTERVDRSRQLFLGILSHDLRNPLNSITVSAASLVQSGDLDTESAGTVSRISSSATAMGRMIADLLDFTGAGLGAAMPLSPAVIDLKKLCREVVEETRSAHPLRLLHFEPHGDLTGEWDAARLRQLVSNLLGNAMQHGGGKGAVGITLGSESSHVRLVVHNDGPPIPPEALPTIFDPLVRDPSPELQKQRRPGSIGLGLFIARQVATAHGGAIDVKSSEQAGTTFTVILPRHPNGSLKAAGSTKLDKMRLIGAIEPMTAQ